MDWIVVGIMDGWASSAMWVLPCWPVIFRSWVICFNNERSNVCNAVAWQPSIGVEAEAAIPEQAAQLGEDHRVGRVEEVRWTPLGFLGGVGGA